MTSDNLNSPWLLFESGAISKKLEESRVCTILFGVTPVDIKGPLSNFQHTIYEKKDFLQLIKTINNANIDEKLDEKVVEKVFEKWWPDLDEEIRQNLKEEIKLDKPARTERDLMEEILTTVREISTNSMSKIDWELILKLISINNNFIKTNDYFKNKELDNYIMNYRSDKNCTKIMEQSIACVEDKFNNYLKTLNNEEIAKFKKQLETMLKDMQNNKKKT